VRRVKGPFSRDTNVRIDSTVIEQRTLPVLFRLFDRDQDEQLNLAEVASMNCSLLELAQFSGDQQPPMASTTAKLKCSLADETAVTLNDFLGWCTNEPLIDRLIQLLGEVACVIFGLRPSSGAEEVTMVK
jgi:hypothetical protein